MIDPFVEGVRSTVQVCNLVILLPVALTIVAARGRWQVVLGSIAGVIVGGWIFVTGWVTLSELALRLSSLLLVAAVLLVGIVLGSPRIAGRHEVVGSPVTAALIVGGTAALVTQWWRPCVGEQLGSILTNAPAAPFGQLPATVGLMLGISTPLVAVGLIHAAWPPQPRSAERLGWVGVGLTFVVGGSVLIGQHGEIVSRLLQWSQ